MKDGPQCLIRACSQPKPPAVMNFRAGKHLEVRLCESRLQLDSSFWSANLLSVINLINLHCVPFHAAAAVLIFFCLLAVKANCEAVGNRAAERALNASIRMIRVKIRSALEHLVRLLMLTKIISIT